MSIANHRFLILLFIIFFNNVACETGQCSYQEKLMKPIIANGSTVTFFYFENDTKETIQLTWAGDTRGIIILVTMSEVDYGFKHASDVYISSNNGKEFERITDNLGEKIYIKRENGLQTRTNLHFNRKVYLICHNEMDKNSSIIFTTPDSGHTWIKSHLDFVLSGKLKFSARDSSSNLVLTIEKQSKTLYISKDGGLNWNLAHRNVQDFTWSGFSVDEIETIYALYSESDSNGKVNMDKLTLSKSVDYGETWKVLLQNVHKMWAPESMQTDEFLPTNDKYVYVPTGRFLYVSHIVTDVDEPEAAEKMKHSLQLSVSDDGGETFKRVHLPTVVPERFFNILEVDQDFVFLHVDEPEDTGYGTLFTSDSTGTIFSESLRRHLYPNHAPVSDFYRVASMRGTYLATQLNPDSTLRTVITHDRGATWKPLSVPEGAEASCHPPPSSSSSSSKLHPPMTTPTSSSAGKHVEDDNEGHDMEEEEEVGADNDHETQRYMGSGNKNRSTDELIAYTKVCGLQISNQFSLRSRVVASAPLSTATAKGLLIAHGHVSTHLKSTPADVFISPDGGYSWRKGIDGPHNYQIANRGGLIVAVPADNLWVDVLRFSTDEGRCWHNIPLSYPKIGNQSAYDETVVFTGLVTEPGGQAMTVAVYGYGTVSQRWRVAVIDFANNNLINSTCKDDDYELWRPHRITPDAQKENEGCLLGMKESFYRLKEGSLCLTDSKFHSRHSSETCLCTIEDYECEYGFWREIGSMDCLPNPHTPELDVCDLPVEDQQRLHELGFRRIPGDRCVGGWEPPHLNQTIMTRLSSCSASYGLLTSKISKVFCILAVLLICVVFLFVFIRARSRDIYPRRNSICPLRIQRCYHCCLGRWNRNYRWQSSSMSSKSSAAFPVPVTLFHTEGEVCRTIQDPIITSTIHGDATAQPGSRSSLSSVINQLTGHSRKRSQRGNSEDRLDLLNEDEDSVSQ